MIIYCRLCLIVQYIVNDSTGKQQFIQETSLADQSSKVKSTPSSTSASGEPKQNSSSGSRSVSSCSGSVAEAEAEAEAAILRGAVLLHMPTPEQVHAPTIVLQDMIFALH